ncbi:ATP-dependent protease La [Nadsonia fulvescens var. elongata DSM 6958]|uniref:Lon protease homolog n=1 Tax=Nadsonia fulvescens var. elongata DSM 6958 TaxID=857566 RepID=A0A1E3PLN4_9ASCO|nr:ATP-dependent protease La [Nadsonia fulvescens var. elongata DSM 6958]
MTTSCIPLASGRLTLLPFSSLVVLPGVIVSLPVHYATVLDLLHLAPDGRAIDPENNPENNPESKHVISDSEVIQEARLLKGNSMGLSYFYPDLVPLINVKPLLPKQADSSQPLSANRDSIANLIIGVVPRINEAPGDLASFATVCSVVRLEKHTGDIYKIVLEGLARVKINQLLTPPPKEDSLFQADCSLFIDGHNGPGSNISIPSALAWTDQDMRLLMEVATITNEIFAILHGVSIPLQIAHLSNRRNGLTGVRVTLANRLEGIINGSNKDIKGTAGSLVDLLASVFIVDFSEQLKILNAVDVTERMALTKIALTHSLEKIRNAISNNPSKVVRKPSVKPDTFIRPKATNTRIRQNSNDDDEADDDDFAQLKSKISALQLPIEGLRIVKRELNRLKRMNPAQAEYQVARTYLEIISDIPWSIHTTDKLDNATVIRARTIMDEDHFGLDSVKKRLLEYLAVLQLKNLKLQEKKDHSSANTESSHTSVTAEHSDIMGETIGKSPILLLVGPPGVGKTSLAKSMARALCRKFQRISLGGVRDEAEIRGHRRTYVGAMPGILVQSLRHAAVNNPVILLDEIDKLASSGGNHGDPSAAMLEVLDPEQNMHFRDHYVDFPIDLSKVLFIATANNLETIPPPLLDRMEIIYLDGYTYFEKSHIARNHLLPKQIRQNGLELNQLKISDELLLHIANKYTREAGVRNLERCLGSVCRGKAVEYVKGLSSNVGGYKEDVTLKNLHEFLGIERFVPEEEEEENDVGSNLSENITHHTFSTPGVVNGLAYMGSGNGGLLKFETTSLPGGSGNIKLTGKLGEVIQESAHIAMSWVRINAFTLGITASPTANVIKDIDIHIHAPAGAIPKDGPSAGLAMTVGLISLFLHRAIPNHIAMTGEMTLRGKVLPVGGIREKLLGAHLAGVRLVILPQANRNDVEEEKKKGNGGIFGLISVKSEDEYEGLLQIKFVKNIWQAISIIFGNLENNVKTVSRL